MSDEYSARTMKARSALPLLLSLVGFHPAFAQGSAGSSGTLEPTVLVDCPTAGMLDKGSLQICTDFYQDGGVEFGAAYGILDRISLGLSYGGAYLIGSQTPVMYPAPGVNVKLRIIEESPIIPALAVGFDTQGHDGYLKDLDRFAVKSPGLYASLSKNYSFLGYLSFHGGTNYSFERSDGDTDLNYFCGAEKTIGPFLSAVVEYDFAINDNDSTALGHGRGYLNAGLRCSLGGGLTISMSFKDLTRNSKLDTPPRRTFQIEYSRAL